MQLEKVNGRVGTALVMFLVFATMTLLALGFPEKARLMPLLVGIPGTLLALFQLVVELRAPRTDKDEGLGPAERRMLGWTLVFFAGLLAFGFVHAAPVLVFAFLLLGRGESLRIALISSIGIWAVLYGFFVTALGMPLFPGLVAEWLVR